MLGGQDSTAIQNPDPTCGGSLPPGACPPFILKSTFFNDVWRSKDGVKWKQMTADAAWSGRAGLSAVVHGKWMYVLGGSVNDDSSIRISMMSGKAGMARTGRRLQKPRLGRLVRAISAKFCSAALSALVASA